MKHLSLIAAIFLLNEEKNQRQKSYTSPDIQQFEITNENVDLAHELIERILVRNASKSAAEIVRKLNDRITH